MSNRLPIVKDVSPKPFSLLLLTGLTFFLPTVYKVMRDLSLASQSNSSRYSMSTKTSWAYLGLVLLGMGIGIGGTVAITNPQIWQHLTLTTPLTITPNQQSPASSPTPRQSVLMPAPSNFVVDVVKETGASVVRINAERKVKASVPEAFNEHFFRGFSGAPQTPNEQIQRGTGSGFIVSDKGQILTNAHVVAGAEEVSVTLKDGRTLPGKVLGSDPTTDVAVVKVEGENLPAVKLGDANALQVGEWTIAIGNPLGLDNTVTTGIVSATGRRSAEIGVADKRVEFIQTDAAINPGNSGGALINTTGQLVGINTAIISKTGSYNGYGFAIPSNIVRKVVADLREFGKVQRAFMGIEVLDLDEKLRKEAELEHMNGVFVTSVSPIGGAHDAGLQAGDVLIGLDKVPLRSKADFDEQMSYHRPGESVEITLERKGKTITKKIRLTNLNGDTEIQKNTSVRSSDLGCELESLTQYELDRLKTKHGVRIASVQAGTLGRMGLREGFVITHINKVPMKTPLEVIDALSQVRGQTVIEGFDQNGGRAVYSFYGF